MRSPSTKTLIVLLAVSLIGAALVIPDYYPAPMPILGPDGLPLHDASGKRLVHRDMSGFNTIMIPGWILLSVVAVCSIWLAVRFLVGVTKAKE